MNTSIRLAVVFTLVISLSGCQRIRQMARRDYAPLGDPFAEDASGESTLAERDRLPANGQRSGIVAVGDLPSDKRSSVGQSEFDRGVRTASATRSADDNRTRLGGVRASGMGEVIRSEIGSNDQPLTSRNFEGFAAAEASNQPSTSTPAPADDKPMPGFQEWMMAQKDKFEGDAANVEQAAIQTVSQTQASLASSANQGIEQAEALLNNAAETAQPLILQPPGSGNSSNNLQFAPPGQMQNLTPPNFEELERPNFEELAQPLINAQPDFSRQQTYQPPSVNPARRSSPPTSSGTANPLNEVNPFAEMERSRQTEGSSTGETMPALKSQFNFDSGWQNQP